MILSHGMGASSYVPDVLVGAGQDEVDYSMLAVLQSYARDPNEWEVMMLLADQSEEWCTPRRLALVLGQSWQSVERNLESLLAKRMIEERVLFSGPSYRLARSEQLRHRVNRLATMVREDMSLSM